MAEGFNFQLEREDPIGVLSTTAPIAEGASAVTIDAEAVERFARAHGGRQPPLLQEDSLHCTDLPSERFLNYLLVLEALNFCFWDEPPRWQVNYRGARHDGYWALAAALHRAIHEDGLPLWDAGFLAALEAEPLARLLRGEGRPPTLLAARLANLREVGQVLGERWEGRFANLVAACEGEAARLVERIVAEFPSFRDEAQWQGRSVRFYKRAQICVADLARLLLDHRLGRVAGLEALTAFADYKVPQVLRAEGILRLASGVAARVDRGEHLPAGGQEEVELRAATIWGCEWIVRALRKLGSRGGPAPTAAGVDFLLWSAGQGNPGLPPYHRTRTIFY